MSKRFFCLMLLAMLLRPVVCTAGSPRDFSSSPVSENCVLVRMTDSELAQASGQGAFLSQAGQGPPARRIILWDEWSRGAVSGTRKDLPNQGQLIISGASH